MTFFYIRYRLQGEVFGVQTTNLFSALYTILKYVGFQEVLEIQKRNFHSLVSTTI